MRRTTKRPPTSTDVAARAGVSRATVSYVLNGLSDSRISEETRKQVRAAADALGYTPHGMARSLRAGHSNTVLIPRSHYPLGKVMNEFHESIAARLIALGYTPLVHLDASIREMEAARTWASLRPAGLLVLAERLTEPSIRLLRKAGIPGIVLIGNAPSPLAATLLIDHSDLGACAAEYLAKKGHRYLACTVPRESKLHWLGQERLRGVQRVGEKNSLQIAGLDLAFDEADAMQAAQHLKQTRQAKQPYPTGIVAFNDEYGILLMHALQDVGLRVPQDVAIVGMDNLEVGRLVRPSLTSVQPTTQQPIEAFVKFWDELIRGVLPDKSVIRLFNPCVHERGSG
jgi:DNA-binding LacI/PurR family transcriptional regulator